MINYKYSVDTNGDGPCHNWKKARDL